MTGSRTLLLLATVALVVAFGAGGQFGVGVSPSTAPAVTTDAPEPFSAPSTPRTRTVASRQAVNSVPRIAAAITMALAAATLSTLHRLRCSPADAIRHPNGRHRPRRGPPLLGI